jgi:hypothetical protein
MRRLLAAAALTGLTLMAAACSTEPEPEGSAPIVAAPPPAPGSSAGASPAPAEPGAAGDKALAGNGEAICTQAQKTSSDFARTFTENLKLQIDAASSDDPAAKKNVEEKVARDVRSYSYALGDLAKLAEDQQIKKGLTDLSKQVDAYKGDVTKLKEEQIAGFREGLDKACGRS